ncbi:hypothetical protein AAFF_G00195840 [Aldrovandia affinis]|uniref:C-type lectin domain-containing protein n=1 Tax=Aldrovandia affinis TaxID=143900 RepID=A0AAD7RIV9_9TELE|nr:hypothetical protein AAFF_G00195840 [Aldrovandia affinis]
MMPVDETTDQPVYSTVGQPTRSPEAQHTGNCGQSSHPNRLAAVCLFSLSLIANLVLCVLYMTGSGGLSQGCAKMVRDLEELRANHSRETEVEREKKKIAFMGMLEKKYSTLDHYCPVISNKRVCKPCPQDWKQFNSKCYYFSSEGKTWMESHSDCIKRGAELVIIESKEEQEFITNHTREGYYWIGLNDQEKEDTWVWADRTPLQNGFWRSGEPDDQYFKDNTTNKDADCAVTVPDENRWDDTFCYFQWNHVCETDAFLL